MAPSSSILLRTDSYKPSHWLQYPPQTETVYSYLESRGGRWPTTVFFGLQYYLRQYLQGKVVTREAIDEADHFFAHHFGRKDIFNRQGWLYILHAHGGRLPVSIKAVPEGTPVENHNVLMTIQNTDPHCPWLTSYLETLLVQTWYGSTVCTQSREMKRVLLHSLAETGDPSLIDFKLHDFGYRGSTSVESAGIGGAAHLVNFKGSDTIEGILVARDYYTEPMAGFSIPAAEHSTITAWGHGHEGLAFANMLDQFPTGLVAVVSDSYDIHHAVSKLWGVDLKDRVLSRQGTLVVRPDSGDPPVVVVEVLRGLAEAFGAKVNAKGYKVLDPHVRVIQGDKIDHGMLEAILDAMKADGWSADNIAFGSGGGLLQNVNRDTQKIAMKCSAIEVAGQWYPVSKAPATDPGKNSKPGRLRLVKTPTGYITETIGDTPGPDALVEVFRDGQILKFWHFADVRGRAAL